MSRLTELISQIKNKDAQLAADLEREYKMLSSRRAFGLNFERHRPEAVELPNRPVRRGDKVKILPKRGSTTKGDPRYWVVRKLDRTGSTMVAHLELHGAEDPKNESVPVEDLVVIAEFKDNIYPGLVSTGKVERGGDKPYHTVINGENFHVLHALTFTHRGRIDAIYIDPPYNTGAKDWKYNNDYVESEDLYRHSKWLAFMERRLRVAAELLNPNDSVLIVSIDEKEYLRLGLLIEQLFPEARLQMVSTVIKPEGTNRTGEFSRTNEFIYFVMFGAARVTPTSDDMSGRAKKAGTGSIEWRNLRRRENTSVRSARPNQFYAIFVNPEDGKIASVGDPLPPDVERESVNPPAGTYAVFPLKPDGTEMLWGVTPEALRERVKNGYARVRNAQHGPEKAVIQYLAGGTVEAITSGAVKVTNTNEDGSVEGTFVVPQVMPKTVWNMESHNAQTSGTLILTSLLPDRRFPFPKSVYAVEDSLRFFLQNKPDAIVLDYFAGSGTTAHAVMRLNRQDGGRRQCICITNNEVAASEQATLLKAGLRPGDADWEKQGICEFITKPRIEAAMTGKTPDGVPVTGQYRFTNEFPMSDGLNENAEFFTLTYETPIAISHNLAFSRVAPLLWLRAGCDGGRIGEVSKRGWDLAGSYAVLFDLDEARTFAAEIASKRTVKLAFIVTDDEMRFQAIARTLPAHVEPVRLYESYLTNFRFSHGD